MSLDIDILCIVIKHLLGSVQVKPSHPGGQSHVNVPPVAEGMHVAPFIQGEESQTPPERGNQGNYDES